MPLRFVLLAIIVAINGFFAAAEVSLVSVRRSRQLVLRQAVAESARANLARYFSPNLVEEIAAGVLEPQRQLTVRNGGQECDLTVRADGCG